MATTLSQLEILSIYKSNVLKFLDSLVDLLKNDETDLSDVIVLRILFENQIPIEESMKKFSKKLLTPIIDGGNEIIPSEMIRKRNDKFFLDYSNLIFAGVNDDKIIRWKQLWRSKRLDKDDREQIWLWMQLFLDLAEMYDYNEKHSR
jgi:hypothetical protein